MQKQLKKLFGVVKNRTTLLFAPIILSAVTLNAAPADACCFFRCWRVNTRPTCCAYRQAAPKATQREELPAPPSVDVAPLESVDTCAERFRKDVLGYVSEINATRARYGLRALEIDVSLVVASEAHSQRQAARGQIFHAPGCGSEIVAQNWGVGVSFAIQQWLQSPPHRALLLSPQFTRLGVGVCKTTHGANYCTARFK